MTKTSESKQKTQEAQEKEGIGIASTTAQIGENGYEELNQSNLQNAIDSQFGKDKAVVTDNGDGTFTVSFIDSKRDYNITSSGVENSINWNEAMASARAPESQIEERNNGVIGIGTDGKPVNMDLWEYTLLDNGTYALNDKDTISGNSDTKGYLGNIENGKIEGTVPQYIKNSSETEFKKVTNLYETFAEISEMLESPKLPNTILEMEWTFWNCQNLKKMPTIPYGVENLHGTFDNCINLENIIELPNSITNMETTFAHCKKIVNVPMLPNSVINMNRTFYDCANLSNISNIPNNVTNMFKTFGRCTSLEYFSCIIPNSVETMKYCFYGCSSLKAFQSAIPESVTKLDRMFYECFNLSGIIEINATIDVTNISDYEWCFWDAATEEGTYIILKGICSKEVLNKMVQQKGENSTINIED